MGLFSFTQEIAMDLGTANTIILNNGNIDNIIYYIIFRKKSRVIEKIGQIHTLLLSWQVK